MELERRTVGSGDPVTVVAHGYGQDLAATRLLAAGVPGTRLLYAARGHGRSPLGSQPLTYDLLASDLDLVGREADRALGTSMGGTTILWLLARQPDRFSRVVVTLPAPVRHRARAAGLVAALRGRDLAEVRAAVEQELPGITGREREVAVRLRSNALLATPALADVAEQLARLPVLPDLAALGRTTAKVLFVAQTSDAVHPVDAAQEWSSLVPGSELVVVDEPARERRLRIRQLTADWLS